MPVNSSTEAYRRSGSLRIAISTMLSRSPANRRQLLRRAVSTPHPLPLSPYRGEGRGKF